MSADREVAEVLWDAIDDKGIRGRLYREDCDYLAEALAPLIAACERSAAERALREAADAALEHFGTWGGAGWAAWLREHADAMRDTP